MGQGFGVRLDVLDRGKHQLLEPLLDGGPLALAHGGVLHREFEFHVQYVALAADQLLVKGAPLGRLLPGTFASMWMVVLFGAFSGRISDSISA